MYSYRSAVFILMYSLFVTNDAQDKDTKIFSNLVATGRTVPEIMEALWLTADEVMNLNSPVDGALRLIKLATRIDGGENIALHTGLANRLLRMGQSSKALSRLSSILRTAERRFRAYGQSCHSENSVICSGLHGSIGACFMELRNFSSAAQHFRTALSLRPEDDAVAWQLALAAEYGGDWPGAVAAYRHWLNLQRWGKKWFRPADDAVLRRRTVAIFCLFRLPDAQGGRWGPSSVERQGIGGSEEAVILLSRELVKLGWHVEVALQRRSRRPFAILSRQDICP
jgi:tetratricopeptide (TPR) repeat protein